ncbi:MAG TPA: tandem-95 repeat protein, partial [Planctomycetaceae bacterium]|nr:tandem-95 repeat protein [Planctomycetaceae bacterium]
MSRASTSPPKQSGPTTVTITIDPVNDAPTAGDDTYSVDEDGTLTIAGPGVLANDTDVDTSDLDAVLVDGPTDGTLNPWDAETGAFTYTPNPNFFGTDTFTYQANDGQLNSSVATVTITVNPIDDPPVAYDDYYSTGEDKTLTVAAPGVLGNDTELDGDPLSALLVDDVARGSLSLAADGSFTYTPEANFHGTDTFTYKNNDTHTDSNVATVTITIDPLNDAPVASGETYYVSQDHTLSVAAPGVLGNDTDADGDALTAQLVAGPTNGSVTLNANGSFSYTPDPGFSGTDTFTYQANDGKADSNVVTVTIIVTSQSDVKFYVVDPAAAATFRYDAAGSSVDQQALDSQNTDPRGATSNTAGDTLWVIQGGSTGTVFVYNTDGTLQGSWQAAGLNQPEGIATEGTDLWIVDAASDQVFYYAGAASRTSGSQAADSSFNLDAANSSPSGITTDGTYIWITDEAADKVFVYDTGGALAGSWTLDAANDAPSGITLQPSGGTDLWVVDRTDKVVYRYVQGTAIWLDGTRSASDTFALAAANTQPEGIADPSGNDPPVANDDYVYDVQEWVPVDIYVLANDYDPNQGDTLTIDSVGQPSQGFVVINTAPNGEDYLTYTADPGFTSDSFTYTIMDDWG